MQTLAQFAYGALSLVLAVMAARMPLVPLLVRASWLGTITIAAFLAPMVWGDAGWGASLIAGVATFLIGLLLLWPLHPGKGAVPKEVG